MVYFLNKARNTPGYGLQRNSFHTMRQKKEWLFSHLYTMRQNAAYRR